MVNFGNIDQVSYAKKSMSKKKKEKNLMRSYLPYNLNRNSSCEIKSNAVQKNYFFITKFTFYYSK